MKTLNIKDPTAYRLARELAQRMGESLTQTVIRSLEERLKKVRSETPGRDLVQEMKAIADRIAKLPVLDTRGADEILGYNEQGLLE